MLHSIKPQETAVVVSGPSNGPTNDLALRQAENDEQLIELWLHGRSRHTQQAYRADAERFMAHEPKPLHHVTLADLQAYADALASGELRPASVHRMLSAVKSLFGFGHDLGYFVLDVARPLRLPGFRDGLADRILDEGEVQRMLALEMNPRNHVLLTLLYAAGLRVSELCGLNWGHLQGRDDGGQITVFGKRDKTRTILLPTSVWMKLQSLRCDAPAEAPVFKSRKKGHLSPQQVWRIVKQSAKRAGVERAASPHWMRHAHASHALDRGAPIHLVQTTLGHSSISTTGRYLHARPTESSATYLPL